MTVKRKIINVALILSGFLILIAMPFVLPVLMLYFILTGGDIPHKSDQELVANFQSHRGDFNQLLQMIQTDMQLKRVDEDWTDPTDPQAIGISRERINEYRRLFQRLGIPRGFSAFQTKDHIKFIASTQGLSVSGSSKGYVYARKKPDLIVEDLDHYWSQDGRSFTAHRHIEDNWYLYFDYED